MLEASSGPSATTASITPTSNRHTPVTVIAVGSVLGVLGVAIILVAIFKWQKDRRRKRTRLQEPEIWRERDDEALDSGGLGSANSGEIFLPASPNPGQTSPTEGHISHSPPMIILSPGWPRRNITQSDMEKRRRYGLSRDSRLLDDTPFEDILEENPFEVVLYDGYDGRRHSVSTVEAMIGSAGPSAAPSRATSSRSRRHAARRAEKTRVEIPPIPNHSLGRRPLPDIPPSRPDILPSREVLIERRRRSSSRWSWSHRATYHEDSSEPLPAYSARRSRSRSMDTTRSRSRRSSVRDVGEGSRRGSNVLLNPPEYPLELARKVAQAYPREPRSPPPPGYNL